MCIVWGGGGAGCYVCVDGALDKHVAIATLDTRAYSSPRDADECIIIIGGRGTVKLR